MKTEIVSVNSEVTRPSNLGVLKGDNAPEFLSSAVVVANSLKSIVDQQNLFVLLEHKSRDGQKVFSKHVKCEGWTTLAALLGFVPTEISCVKDDDVYVATVGLVRVSDGKELIRASAECGKDGMFKHTDSFARRSMSQTRATAKACRLAFSWVMTLAGYEATPAEEMFGIGATAVEKEIEKKDVKVEVEVEEVKAIEVKRDVTLCSLAKQLDTSTDKLVEILKRSGKTVAIDKQLNEEQERFVKMQVKYHHWEIV